jgi:hypothetical protein
MQWIRLCAKRRAGLRGKMAMGLGLHTSEVVNRTYTLRFDHGKAQAIVPSVKFVCDGFRLVKPSVAIETSMCFVATLHRSSIRRPRPKSKDSKVWKGGYREGYGEARG